MVRYRQTEEILKLIGNRERVRNIGIIAHVDHGKCITGDSLIYLADGSIIRIDELFKRYSNGMDGYGAYPAKIKVYSLDPASKKIVVAESSHIWRLRKDKLVRIRLRNGFEITTTPEHPFFTINRIGLLEAVRAIDLKPGKYIAIPRTIPSNGQGIKVFKEEVIKALSNRDDYYIYVDNYLAGKIDGSNFPGDRCRFRGSKLRDVLAETGLEYCEVYDHILHIEYRMGDGGRHSRFKLPKTEAEFRDALYSIGYLYGLWIAGCRMSGVDGLASKRFIDALFNSFGVGIGNRRGEAYNLGLAFKHFLRDVFNYPFGDDGEDFNPPPIINLLDDGLLKCFIRGLLDASSRVGEGWISINLAHPSRNILYWIGYIFQRLGVIPEINLDNGGYIIRIDGDGGRKIYGSNMPIEGFESLSKYIAGGRLGILGYTDHIPVDPRELKALRLSLAISRDDIDAENYQKYEDGEYRLTRDALRSIIKSFMEAIDVNRIRIVLSKVKSICGDGPRITGDGVDGEVIELLVNEGIIERSGEHISLTDYGERIVEAWSNIINDGGGMDTIHSLMGYWEEILDGDIAFIEVVDVSIIRGDFDVYDLTIPGYHTFISNGIIVHNTTLTDSLLAASGLLSPKVAGEARALDYLEEEQKRGITIKTANISLLHEYDGKPYVINLIDTPGHVDFTGKVTRALRAIDGAVVVVDAVEEVMVQTETVTRQALDERVKPLLFINKIDRLITELRLGPKEIQKKLARIISSFNRLISIFGEEGFKEKWLIRPDLNNVAFGSAKDRWGFTLRIAQEKGFTFNDVLKFYEEGRVDELREIFPVHRAVQDMVVEHIPNPIEAQKYRIPRIWKGDLDSDIGRAMMECDEDGPVAFMVTNVMVDEKAGLVATGRLLSGRLEPGMEVYLVNKDRRDRILQVGMYMGPYREVVPYMIAGNIPAVLGIDDIQAGETVSTLPNMVPFEAIRYISEPVVTVSIEPKNTRDLPKLINSLRKLAIEDPNLHVKINEETGEYLLSGMGTLHLEVSLNFLRDMGIEVIVSQPIVVYRETISRNSPIFPGKSPNKHNKIKIRLEKLDEEIVNMILTGELNERLGRRMIQRLLMEKGWSAEEARNVWAIDNEYGNILVDMTKGVQYLQESKQMLIGAFYDFVREGALAREPLRGIKVVILDALFHEDPAHRTLAQVVPMMHRALLGAELISEPTLYEPIMKIQVQVPVELIGAVTSVLASKRGQVTSIDQREYYAVVNGYIPVAETFDLAQVLRGATGGRAFWQSQFSHWQILPKSLVPGVVSEIRRRKGLTESPPDYRDFIPPGEEIEEYVE